MNKIVILGDIHGRNIWKSIIEKETPDKVIFMGDYFDSFIITSIEQLNNFRDIINFKRNSEREVILLYGNHDHHYMRVGETYSGYQAPMQFDFENELRQCIRENLIQIAYTYDDLLFTHAGVSTVWLDKWLPETTMETLVNDLNELLLYQPKAFNFAGFDPYGNSQISSPIWIRMTSLLRSNRNQPIKKTYRQVVGHTQVNEINLNHYSKNLGGRYFMVDALNARQYLIYENNEFRIGTI